MLTRSTYNPQCILAGFATLIFGVLLASSALGQTPFNGISIQEVEISAASQIEIDTQLDAGNGGPASARCWRVYICMDDPDWELQAIWGDANAPWHLDTSTEFYQNSFGSHIAADINPLWYTFVPDLEFDSWFTIGHESSPSSTSYIALGPNPMDAFELDGTGFYESDIDGSILFGNWNPPNSEGRPDGDNKLLIAQFTTDGPFWGTMNFQFRRLNSDGTVFVPIEWISVTGVYINGLAPGNTPDNCPIVFLPVELLEFNARPVAQQVVLDWATASEVNNDYFTVERSADKQVWEDIVQLDGSGSTTQMNLYSTIDPKPLLGTSYYRLKQTDTNGEHSLSQVVPVTFIGQALEVYPNPTTDIFFVKGDLTNVSAIQVVDGRGRTVSFDQQTNLNREWNLYNLGLERGIYFVEFILDSGVVITKKLILQ